MDFKFALRSLRKNLGFTILAVMVMAMGIGANTAMFSVVNSVLLQPLAYPDPDRIVTLASLWKQTGSHGQASAPDFHDWHDQSAAFTAMAYYTSSETAVSVGSSAEYAHTAQVSAEFFRVFQAEPLIGRPFHADEIKPGSAGAALISHSYWQSHFGGETRALGQTIRLSDRPLNIVGVMPPRFQFPDTTDIWFPTNTIFSENTSRSAHNYRVVARLKAGVTLDQARVQMGAIGDRLERQFPPSNESKGVWVARMRDEMVSDFRLTLFLLLGAVGAVLLIACANVANLLLAKATARTREMAIRAAVGATRARIVRQLVTESLVLAVLSGGMGLLLALFGSRALVALAPANIPRLAQTGIDGWVLAFTFGVSVLASLLFGLAPALRASRVDLNESLKQGGARSVVGGPSGHLRAALVVAEIALSVMLLTGAGLLIKSFAALHNVALGFRPENVLIMQASVPSADLDSALRAARFYRDLLVEASALPGVSAAGATRIPPGRVGSNGGYWIDHLPGPEGLSINSAQAVFSVVTPGAFQALGIPIKQGRDFTNGDTYEAPFTAVINEALARKAFPGKDPIGHVIFCGLDSLNPMKIVGIVGDVRQYGPAREPAPEIYMPHGQHPRAATSMSVIVRASTDPGPLAEALRRKARDRSPDVPVKFSSMEARLAENVAAPRFRTLLLGIFAGLAVCLAMAGVYGVMAYAVGQRASEIGLRMALGASAGDVQRLILGQGLQLAGIGLVLGLAGAMAATRLLTSVLFQVKPGDPMTYAGVAALLTLVALAASYIPARRAAHLDPLVALRQE